MDARNRFRRVMRFEPVDRPPYWEVLGPAPATVERWHEEGLPPDEYLDACFEFDRIEAVPVDDGLVPAFAEEVRDFRAGVVTRQDALGRVCRRRGARVLEVVSYPLVTRADLGALQRRLDARSPRRFPRRWADYLRSVRDRDYPLGLDLRGPLGRLVDLAGPTWTAALVEEDPALVHEALDAFTAFLVDLVRPVLAGVGDADFVVLRESLFGQALSREAFDLWLAPRYRALLSAMADHGVGTVILVCPGDLRDAVEGLKEVGVRALAPLSVEAGMDPVALKREHGSGLVLIGGIDARALTGDREAVEREVMGKAPALLQGGGWIPSLDSAAPPEVPLENYQAYWELVRDLAEGQ